MSFFRRRQGLDLYEAWQDGRWRGGRGWGWGAGRRGGVSSLKGKLQGIMRQKHQRQAVYFSPGLAGAEAR